MCSALERDQLIGNKNFYDVFRFGKELHRILSMLQQNEGGFGKSQGGGDGFPNTSHVLVEYGHSPHHQSIYRDGSIPVGRKGLTVFKINPSQVWVISSWLVSEGFTYPAGKIVYEVGGGYEARFTAGALPGNFHCYLLPV